MSNSRLHIVIGDDLNDAIQAIADLNKVKKSEAIRCAIEQYVQTQNELHDGRESAEKLLAYIGKLNHKITDGLTLQREIRANGVSK